MKSPEIRLHLLRHAETVMNVDHHLIGGQSNETSITWRGVVQAINLGNYMLMNNIKPNEVYTSTAYRAQQTAYFMLKTMGIWGDVPISEHEAFLELSQGRAEGKPRDSIYTPEVLEQIAIRGKDFKLPGGESMNEVAKRAGEGINTVLSDVHDDRTIFIVMHGGTIKYIVGELSGWSHEQTYRTPIDNCSDTLLVGRPGDWRLEYINKVD